MTKGLKLCNCLDNEGCEKLAPGYRCRKATAPSNPKLADLFGGCARCCEYFTIIGAIRNSLRDAGCRCNIGDGDYENGKPEKCPLHRLKPDKMTAAPSREQRTLQPKAEPTLTVEAALKEADRCRRYPDPVLNEQVIVVLADEVFRMRKGET